MKTSPTPHCIIALSYEEYHPVILRYIKCRITHRYQAEDLAQDVFVRLLDYQKMLRPDTVKYFLFTIARNIITDYLRRYYKKKEIDSYMYDTTMTSSNETEQTIWVNDLLSLEQNKLATLAPQRQRIYRLCRFEGKTPLTIAQELGLSARTVENHLLLGRREMRIFLKQCI